MPILYQNIAFYHLKQERRIQWKNRGNIESLLNNGNFGCAAMKNLSYELIVLEGIVYALDQQGNVFYPDKTEECSFTTMIQFEPSDSFELQTSMSFEEFLEATRQRVPKRTNPYAVKCEGSFELIKGRTVYALENDTVNHAEDNWPKIDFSEIEGTMVGFIFPEYMNSILAGNQSHFHFIDKTKTCGCHVFEFAPNKIKVETMAIRTMELNFDEF